MQTHTRLDHIKMGNGCKPNTRLDHFESSRPLPQYGDVQLVENGREQGRQNNGIDYSSKQSVSQLQTYTPSNIIIVVSMLRIEQSSFIL